MSALSHFVPPWFQKADYATDLKPKFCSMVMQNCADPQGKRYVKKMSKYDLITLLLLLNAIKFDRVHLFWVGHLVCYI